jgi:hypothetical protein
MKIFIPEITDILLSGEFIFNYMLFLFHKGHSVIASHPLLFWDMQKNKQDMTRFVSGWE